MTWQTLFNLLPSLISIGLSAYIGFFALRRETPESKPFGLMAFAQTAWTLGYIFELTSASLEKKIFWDNVQWIFAYLIPLAFLVFTIRYTRREVPRLNLWLVILSTPVAIFILLLFIAPLRGFTIANPRLVPGIPFDSLFYQFTPLVLGFSAFFYSLFVAGVLTLLIHFFHSSLTVRVQIVAMILGGLIPVVGTLLTLTGLTPDPIQRDISPYTFTLCDIVIAWALYRYQMLNVAPLARNFFFENMREGVIVLDVNNRITDINIAAEEIIGVTGVQVTGSRARDVLAPWPHVLEAINTSGDRREMIVVGDGEGARHYDVLLAPLNDRMGRAVGSIITLRTMDGNFVQSIQKAGEQTMVQKGDQPERRDEPTQDAKIEGVLNIHSAWGIRLLSFFYPPANTELSTPAGREPLWYQTLERIFTAVFRLGILLLVAMVLLVRPAYETFPQAYLILVALTLCLLVLAVFRTISFDIRSIGFLFVFYFLGVMETVIFGLTAESFTYFTIVIVAGGTLTSGKTRNTIILASLATIFMLGLGIGQMHLIPLVGDQVGLASYQVMRVFPTILAFMAVTLGLSTVTTLIWEIAHQTWQKEKQTSNLLQQERDLLEQRVKERSNELAEAEKKYRLLVENLPAAVYQDKADLAGTNIYFSPQVENITGYSPEDLKSNPILWQSLVHPEDYELGKTIIQKILVDGKASSEYRICHKNGSTVWVRDEAVLVNDDSGVPLYVLGSVSDVTARVLAFQRQEESEKLISHVMENINEVFWVTDLKRMEDIYISPSAQMIWDRSPEDLMDNKIFLETVFERDRARVSEWLDQQRHGKSDEIEYRIVRPDGSIRWIWDRSFVMFDESGNVSRVAGFSTDITELRLAQSELEVLAQQYEDLFEQSPVSLWEEDFSKTKQLLGALSEQGVNDIEDYLDQHPEFVVLCAESVKITNVNQATLNLFKASNKTELLGGLSQIFNQRSMDGFKAELLHIADGETQFSTVIENYTLAGGRMDVSLQWSVVKGYENTLSRVIISLNDVTREFEAKKILQQQSEEYAALSQIAIDLLDRRSLDELLKTAVEKAAYLLDAPYCELMIPDGEKLVVRSFTDNQPYLNGDVVSREEAKLSWQAYDTRQPVIIDNYSEWAGRREIYDSIHMQASADFPIIVGNSCIGVLGLGRDRVGYSFSEHQVQLGQWLTQILALILDNAQLLETTRLQVSALRSAANAIVITDRSGAIQWVNPSFTGLTGYTLEEARGKNPRILQSGRTPRHLYEDLWSTINSGQAWVGEVINRRKDGTEYIEEMTITPFNDEHGNINRFIAIKQDVTRRKEVEQALKESEERYRSVVSTMTEGIVLQDKNGSIIAHNQAAEDILGLSNDQITGRISIDASWRAVHVDGVPFPGDSHPAMYTLRTGEPQSNVIMGVHASDKPLTWISINTQPIWGDETETPSAVVASFTNITERKMAEDLLRASEERYRLIYENIDDVVYQTDYHGRITGISPSIMKQAGYMPEEVIGQHAEIFYAVSDDYAILDTLFQSSGAVNDYELRLKRKDGSVIYVSLTARTIFNDQGQPVGTEGVMRNISERKQAEDRIIQANIELENRVIERTTEIQAANRYLSTLLETSIILNKNLNTDELLDHILTQAHSIVTCRTINLMFTDGEQAYIVRRLGYKRSDDVDRNLVQSVYSVAWPTFKDMTNNRIGICINDTSTDPEWQSVPGSEWVRAYIGIPLLVGNQVIGFLNFNHDEPGYFSQKDFNFLSAFASHAAIAIQNARLLDEVKQSLEKEKEMRDKLVHADKLVALGKMVAVIAHEINNPIQTVKNTFYLLEDQVAPGSPASEYLEIAAMEATRISDLVTQLREAYRPRSKNLVLVSVPQILKDVHLLLGPQLKKSQVECNMTEPDQPCMVMAIQDNLKQVFINLCMNALEAMSGDKAGRIGIHYNFDLNSRKVGIAIHNTGPLIPEEDLAHIFEPFFTTKGLGSGLGLSICFDIIKQHSGEITVENDIETGVTFTVWLPLAPEQDQK